MSDHLFWLSGAQFERLKSLLPDKVRGVPRVDDRRVISDIVFDALADAGGPPKAKRSSTVLRSVRIVPPQAERGGRKHRP